VLNFKYNVLCKRIFFVAAKQVFRYSSSIKTVSVNTLGAFYRQPYPRKTQPALVLCAAIPIHCLNITLKNIVYL